MFTLALVRLEGTLVKITVLYFQFQYSSWNLFPTSYPSHTDIDNALPLLLVFFTLDSKWHWAELLSASFMVPHTEDKPDIKSVLFPLPFLFSWDDDSW